MDERANFQETYMTIKNLMRYALITILCCVISLSGHAQSSTQGAIGGTVFDSTGAVLDKATVNIRNDGTNAEVILTTDNSGYFKAPLLEPGTYTVTVTASGFTQYRA